METSNATYLKVEDFVEIKTKEKIYRSNKRVSRWEHKDYPVIEIRPDYWGFLDRNEHLYHVPNGKFIGVIRGMVTIDPQQNMEDVVKQFSRTSLERWAEFNGFKLK